jgi:hypothetical protein
LPLTCAFLDLIYALTSNPKITVFSIPFGTTLKGAYAAKIIKVLEDRHKFVKTLPVAYVHAQSQRNIRFTHVCRWAAMGQIVDCFQEFAALLSYLAKLLAHLYPPNSLRQKSLECSASSSFWLLLTISLAIVAESVGRHYAGHYA